MVNDTLQNAITNLNLINRLDYIYLCPFFKNKNTSRTGNILVETKLSTVELAGTTITGGL